MSIDLWELIGGLANSISFWQKSIVTFSVIGSFFVARIVFSYLLNSKTNRTMIKTGKSNQKCQTFNTNLTSEGRPGLSNVNYERQSWVDPVSKERRPQFYSEDGPNYKLMTHLYDDARTLLEALERGCSLNANGNCLGRIDSLKKSVEWLTYSTVLQRVEHFGSGLYSALDRAKLQDNTKSVCVGIYSANCAEYVIAEYGCYRHSMVVVPIYDTLGPNACSFISNQTEIECIVCDKLERFQIILSQASVLKSLRFIVVFKDIPQSYKLKANSYGIKVLTIKEVENLGAIKNIPPKKPSEDDLAVICYTSGTTSTPKGVMLSHGNIIANVSAVLFQMLDHTIRMDDVMLSYLPLAHMFERNCENALFMVGGSVAFFSGDVRLLMNDLKIVKPTLLPAVPRLLTRIYCKIHDSVKSNVIKNFLLNTAYHFKQKQIEKSGVIRNNTIWDKIVFNKVRENLGGRVRLIMSGSAPLNRNVLEFLRCTLGCTILEGYGQTECVAPCNVTFPGDSTIDHVGPPICSAIVKLCDVPEMDYFAKDGKGEVLVKGPIVFKGYYKNPQLTAQTIDSDGWLHTGDIGMFNENETLKIIDRKKNIFKLSQGEYIAPEKIENIYSQSSLVAQIFVYGESVKSTLVGILVPDEVVLEMWCRNNNIDGTFEEMCRNKEVKKFILKELHSLGTKDGLKSFEQVKDIYIHPELFSIDKGLITPTFKAKRNEILKQFKKEIDELYARLD